MTDLPTALAPVDQPKPPAHPVPAGACDAHVHIVGDDFALWEGRVENPAPGDLDSWVARLDRHLDALHMERVVIVHSILYGDDNSVTTAGVARLGLHRARAIGLVTDGASDAELDALAEAGVAGVRLNYVHGGILTWQGVREMAPRLAERGLHVQMLMNAHKHMEDIAEDVARLPVPVVFDHIGWPDLAAGPAKPGFDRLVRLVGEGQAYVKLSGIYRVANAPYEAAAGHVAALARANPDHCLWGSDWPHLMLADAAQPDAGDLLNRFFDVVTGTEDRTRILTEAPARLFGFDRA